MRIALLSYRSKPHVGGQGIYIRRLSRELVALGHTVEVFSGQPYPDLDEGVVLTKVPSLDLYRPGDEFRNPHPREFRDLVDVEEWLRMRSGAFPEPLTFAKRVVKLLRERRDDFDIVLDNQTLATPILDVEGFGLPLASTILARVARRVGLPSARLSPAAAMRLAAYAFPGNVRELENILERAVALAGDDVLMADDLMLPDGEIDLRLDPEPPGTLAEEAEGPVSHTAEPSGPSPALIDYTMSDGVPSSLPAYLDALEREAVLAALGRTRYNRTAAAQLLGITFRQLRYRMQRLGLK